MTRRDTTESEIREAAAVYDAGFRIPAGARLLDGFRRWALSDSFPEDRRIDYLAGEVEVEMSPEDLHTHGTVKTAIAAELFDRFARSDEGFVFADRTRITSPASELSVEPDGVVVLFASLDAGRIRQVPAVAKGPGRYVELEGAPDLVVEIVSDSSVGKDTERLPPRYAAAGVCELWLVDARGAELRLDVKVLDGESYRDVAPDGEGRIESPLLGGPIRLTRRPTRHSGWFYELELEG